MNEEFQILLKAIIDEKDVQTRLKQMNDLEVKIQKAKLSKSAINQIQKELKTNGIEVKLKLGNNSGFKGQAAQLGKQVGSTISNSIQNQLDKIQLNIDTSKYESDLKKLEQKLHSYKQTSKNKEVYTKADNALIKANNAYNTIKSSSGDARIVAEKEYQKQLSITKNLLKTISSDRSNKLIDAGDSKRVNMVVTLNKYLAVNTKMTRENKNEVKSWIQQLESAGAMTQGAFDQINNNFKKLDTQLRSTGRLGLSAFDKLKQTWAKFGGWSLASGTLMKGVHEVRQAFTELKDVDTYLTEISKANDQLSKSDLSKLGTDSFDIASKYGKKATNFLSAMQTASRAGYKNAEDIAELSVKIQGAGDVTEETANSYVVATDKAYKLGGAVENLQQIFDGANKINTMVLLYGNI